MGGPGLEVVGVVKWAGTGEQDGGTGGVEHGVCYWEGRDMERLCVRVGRAIDLASDERMSDRVKRERERSVRERGVDVYPRLR